jgi:hypothetical protein
MRGLLLVAVGLALATGIAAGVYFALAPNPEPPRPPPASPPAPPAPPTAPLILAAPPTEPGPPLPPTPNPKVMGSKMAPPAARGSDADAIGSTMRANARTFRACYERLLVKNPKLGGKVVVNFVIGSDGRVTQAHAHAEGMSAPKLMRCIAGAVKRLVFPRRADEAIGVTYPLVFRNAP